MPSMYIFQKGIDQIKFSCVSFIEFQEQVCVFWNNFESMAVGVMSFHEWRIAAELHSNMQSKLAIVQGIKGSGVRVSVYNFM